jgi:hypothetical protein
MLLKKKLFHVLNFLKSKTSTTLFLTYWVFYNLKNFSNYLFIYLSLVKCCVKKKQLPFFLITFKVNVLHSFFFNNILFKIFDFIKKFNLYFTFKYSSIKSIKNKYTILRSPFVYKKSKEQFFFKSFKGFFTFDFKKINIFFVEYLEIFWIASILFIFPFKILVKKTIYFQFKIKGEK